MVVHGFHYNQPQLLRGLKLKKMVKSTAQAQIVPRFKQLRLKFMAQQATFLVDKHLTGRQSKNHLKINRPGGRNNKPTRG